MGQCIASEFGRGVQVQLIHQLCFVKLNGLGRDIQCGRDFFDRVAFGDQLEDLPLSWRQRISTFHGWRSTGHGRLHQSFRDQRGNVVVSAHDGLNGLDEFRSGGPLEEIALCACFEGFGDVGLVGVHRDEDDSGVGQIFVEFAGGVDPIQMRHGDIERHNIRLELMRHLQQGAPVFSGADDIAGPLQ